MYQRHDFAEKKRQSLAKWGHTLRQLPLEPSFASAANKIGNNRLEPILEELSHYVTYEPPKRAELRTALTTLRDKTDTFEKALNAITPYLLDLPFPEMECLIARGPGRLSSVRAAIKDVKALCDEFV